MTISKNVQHAIFLFGFLVGFLDMALLGPVGFRPSEVFLLMATGVQCIYSCRVTKSVTLLTILAVSIVIAYWQSPSQVAWFLKLVVFAYVCIVILENKSQGFFQLSLGVVCGFSLASLLIALGGNSFDAKYAAVQFSIFLAIFSIHRIVGRKFVAVFFGLVSVYVAIASNSRGQFALCLIIALVLCLNEIRSARTESFNQRISLLFFMPALFVVVKLSVFFVITSKVEDLIEFNAGDFERSLLGFYAISSLLLHPLGQSEQQVLDGAGSLIADFSTRDLNTVSAHNIIEDSILFGGWLGGVIILIIGIMIKRKVSALLCERLTKYQSALSILTIALFVCSTSPMAGLERIEVMLLVSAISIIGCKSKKLVE